MVRFSIEEAYNGDNENKSASPETKKKNLSISVREIKNGYIVSRSWEEEHGDDCCTKWCNEEEYSAENPVTVK